MAEARERPILFSGPMVRAIVDGRKTQTRRVVGSKTTNLFGEPDTWEPQHNSTWRAWCDHTNQMEHFVSPYGMTGNRLWVRETWLELDRDHWGDGSLPREAVYSHPNPRVNACAYRADTSADGDEIRRSYGYRWRPSIHMPRWASRLTLEVTSIRVERLHDITEADAIAEGVERHREPFTVGWRNYEPEPPFESVAYHPTARESFASLWRSINGPYAWDSNPWVWVVEFRRVEGSSCG